MRLVIHSTILVLLTFAGTVSGSVLCIGHDGHISIEAECNGGRCCGLESSSTEEIVRLGSGHQCCVDVPLPESRIGETLGRVTVERTSPLKFQSSFAACGSSWSQPEFALQSDPDRANHPLPLAPTRRTVILLI